MLLNDSQINIVKKLFYLALILTSLDIFSIYLLQGLLGLKSDHLGYKIVNNLIYITNPIVLWYLVGRYTKDRTAALLAIAVTFIIYFVLTIISIFNDTSAGFDNIFSKTLAGSLPFLVFGIVHHKSAKGLLYLIPFFIFHGLYLGDLNFILDQVDRILRHVDLDGLLELKIPSNTSTSSYWQIYPLSKIIFFCQVIIQFILMVKFYSILSKKKWNDFILREVKPINIGKFGFSIIFWVSRFILLSLLFAFVYRMQWFNDTLVPKSILFLWLPSLALASFVFLSFYRNFLTSYFISKNLLPGWRYLLLNIPVINFFIWLNLILAKKTKKEKPVLLTEQIIKKQFDYTEKNINIKVTLTIAIIIITLMKYLNFHGTDKESLILIVNGLVSLIFLIAYFSNSRFYLPILIFSILIFFSLPILGGMESYPLIIASIINVIIWYPLYHLDKMTFAKEN